MADTPTIYTVRAMIRGVDQAPRKVSLVASLVRGRTVADAVVILDHTPKRSALAVKKAIQSAAANATNNHGLDAKSLSISTLSVTTGPRLRRFKPASRGRALPFEKKSSHILVEVSGVLKVIKKAATKTADATEKIAAQTDEKPAAKEEKK